MVARFTANVACGLLRKVISLWVQRDTSQPPPGMHTSGE
jgi:hypothetical protein